MTTEVQKKSGEVGCVLCVGHNKGMEEAASSLAVRPSSCMNTSVCAAQLHSLILEQRPVHRAKLSHAPKMMN